MPPSFKQIGPIQYYQHGLDGSDVPVIALGFRIIDVTDELWTARFNLVKNRDPAAMKAAARMLARAVSGVTFPQRRTVVVGAISSADTTLAAGCPVYVLGEAVARALGYEWMPGLLTKRPHASLHGLKGASARHAAVDGAYSAGVIGGAVGAVLVVDDFCTRGDTFADIRRAILESNPGWKVTGVALAKNERRGYVAGLSNDHMPASLGRAWEGKG